MDRTFGTDSSVGSTRALLEARLPAVRERRRQLEDALAATVAQENAITAVLEGLDALVGVPIGGPDRAAGTDAQDADEPPAAVQDTAGATPPAPAPAAGGEVAPGVDAPARPARRTSTRKAPPAKAPAKKTAARKTSGAPKKTTAKQAAPKAAPAADPQPAAAEGGKRRRLTDAQRVLDVLADSDGPLRAGEVSSRLGLDGQNGAVDAVRTTLERLTKAARVQRTGRGLYAPAVG